MEQHFLERGWTTTSRTLKVSGAMLDQPPCYVKTFEICFYLFGEEAGPDTLVVASEI
ncbi:hypothetical protein [Deinococcus marmoris]|uniref:hypothetical protein n=1 Tax=Deinococcus marmoris TaxID=249408 RepID=UPI000B265576|nr:hypothetical protein [Deinococcus marmoris]